MSATPPEPTGTPPEPTGTPPEPTPPTPPPTPPPSPPSPPGTPPALADIARGFGQLGETIAGLPEAVVNAVREGVPSLVNPPTPPAPAKPARRSFAQWWHGQRGDSDAS